MTLSPMRILCGASDCRSAWASVLQAMNSTPIISARIIRLTALEPPPPTPMTRISAKFSESERSGIGLSSGDLWAVMGWRSALAVMAGSGDPSDGRPGRVGWGSREYSADPPRVDIRSPVSLGVDMLAGAYRHQ